jgi:hypothetical protein
MAALLARYCNRTPIIEVAMIPQVSLIVKGHQAAFTVTVDFEVTSGYGDDGAKAGEDFVPISGTLTFQPSETEQTYCVQIIGDTLAEADEAYSSLISNANVPITVGGSLARILSDDDHRIYLPLMQR